MLQTDRKATETTRRTDTDKAELRKNQSPELQPAAATALQAILAGGDWDTLPAEGVLGLSHSIGNAALADLAARRSAGREPGGFALPESPCMTAPADVAPDSTVFAEPPAFGAMAPLGAAAPMAI